MKKYLLGTQAAVAVASFLPWVSVLGITALGIQGDGSLTLGLAVIGAILVGLGRPRRPRFAKGIQATLAALVVVIAGFHLGAFAAGGVYLAVVAGLAWLALALIPARVFTRATVKSA